MLLCVKINTSPILVWSSPLDLLIIVLLLYPKLVSHLMWRDMVVTVMMARTSYNKINIKLGLKLFCQFA